MKIDKSTLTQGELKRIKICECCKNEYIHSIGHPNQMYCFKACKIKMGSIKHKLNKGLKCKVCSGDIPHGRGKRTCGEECQKIHDAKMKIHRQERMNLYNKTYHQKKPLENRICDICGDAFKGKGNALYCSNPECAHEGARRSKYAYYLRVTKPKKIIAAALKKARLQEEAIKEEEDWGEIPLKFLVRGKISQNNEILYNNY